MSETERGPTGWLEFHGKPVMLQLRYPYMGVQFSYDPTIARDGSGVRASEYLKGILSIAPGHEEGKLMLLLSAPIPEPGEAAVIALHPEDVVYCTHIKMKEDTTAS